MFVYLFCKDNHFFFTMGANVREINEKGQKKGGVGGLAGSRAGAHVYINKVRGERKWTKRLVKSEICRTFAPEIFINIKSNCIKLLNFN